MMDEAFKYEDYKLYLNLTEFNSYDEISDKMLTMNQTRYFRLNNSVEEDPSADNIAGSKGALGNGAEALGALATVASPGLAGPFISLVAVIKLLDKVRFINVRYGKILGSFLNVIAGGVEDDDLELDDSGMKLNREYGKLTILKADYEVEFLTKVKACLFMLFMSLRFLKNSFAK
jgi:hypothetical protein